MSKGILAAALFAALTFVGIDSQEAEAGNPYYFRGGGGPRVTLSIGSGGYGGFRDYGGYYNRRAMPAYGVTLGYGRGYNTVYRATPQRQRYAPPRRCDYDYGYGRGGYRY